MNDTQACPVASTHIHTDAHAYAYDKHIIRKSGTRGMMYGTCMVSDSCQCYHHPHPTTRVHFPCYKTQIWMHGAQMGLLLNCHTGTFNACSLEQVLNCGARPNLVCCLILWITFYWYTLTLMCFMCFPWLFPWYNGRLSNCNTYYNHTITKPEKIMVWSFTESFTDPVSEYLWSRSYTFHFFPVMIAGPIGTAQFTLPW